MKNLIRLVIAVLLGTSAYAQAACPTPTSTITPSTHEVCLAWVWSQASGPAATQFNVMRSTVSGGCNQVAAIPPSTTNTFPSGCSQVGLAPPNQFSYIDQGNATTNLLTEAKIYCYVVVTQGANGAISVNSNEVCQVIPLVKPAASTGLTGAVL